MRVPIDASHEAALEFRVDVVRIRGILEHPEAVAIEHVFPLRVADAARILRFSNPRTVVLQTAVNPIGIVVIQTDMVELRHGQVVGFPPFASPIVGIPHPAVVPGKDGLWIGWIDPYVMHVSVRPLESPHHRETFSPVLAQDQRAVGLEHAVRIFGIDNQVCEVKRPPDHPITLVAFVPRCAAVVGNVERAIGRLDESVNAFRI